MPINRRLSAAALLLALAACGTARQAAAPVPAAPARVDARAEIYTVLLESMSQNARRTPRYVLTEAVPSPWSARDDYLVQQVPEVTPELVAAFRAANARQADIRALVGHADVEWITRDSLAEVMRIATTPQLPKSADFSTTRFSPVGFSADGQMALVYVQYWCGGLCAHENWAVLRRQPDGRWMVLRTVITLVS
jgi:hypothetical protein